MYDDVPEWLNPHGREEWVRITRLLAEHGALGDLKRTVVEAYCAAYGQWREAEDAVRQYGPYFRRQDGTVRANPMLDVARHANRQMRLYMRELRLADFGEPRGGVAAGTERQDLGDYFRVN